MTKSNLKFRVSSALKNIIGKDLITNKYIAIFELVKNSFDAYADKVELIFDDDKVVVKDNGKGMDLNDIRNKWLFVAYSAKADDTEDQNYKDYRKKINQRKAFAGAKGIGRFACDRLGKKMRLISIKEGKNPKIESLEVFWESFERDSKDNFIDIEIKHARLSKNPYPEVEHGTIIQITELREPWPRSDINSLKKHLAKLINPIPSGKKNKPVIQLTFNGEQENIDNFIFDKLKLRTTQVEVDVSKDGKFLTTELTDRGEKIYKIKEMNPWRESLSDINVQLFYLSTPAKIMFAHLMGVPTVQFGSVFLYKNGFRVFPFGEQRDDTLGLDSRKQQGFARYLGTRELVGLIAIESTADQFKETSSRDGGLIETQAYIDLKKFFFQKVLRRLEVYVIDTLNWTYSKKTHTEISPDKKREQIIDLIKQLTQADDFVAIEYGFGLANKIREKARKGFEGATEQLIAEANKTGDVKLLRAVKQIKQAHARQKRALDRAEESRDIAEKKSSAIMKVTDQDFKNLVSYHHQIGISALTVDEYISKIFKKIREKEYSKVEQYLQKIKKENDKINSIARFASGSGMKENATKKTRSLSGFIVDYIEGDYGSVASGGLAISIENKCKDFQLPFRPFDISTIIDNLLSNSRKAKAKKVKIKLSCNKKSLDLAVEDDGIGLDSSFKSDPSQIFEAKTSTTNGSGWGLFHVKEILESLGAEIRVQPKRKGIKFIMVFNR